MSEIKIKTIKEFQEDGTSPEILFWVGCAGSFDDRAKKITKAFVKILNSANISLEYWVKMSHVPEIQPKELETNSFFKCKQ